MLDNVLAHSANRQRTEQGGRGAFAGHVAEGDSEAAFAVRKKIVEIAAQLARGAVTGGQVEAGDFASAAGKKLALNFSRSSEIVMQAALSFAGFFVQAGVFERDGNVRGKRGEHALVLRGECVRFRTFQVQNANLTILYQERNDKFGANGHT